MKTNWWLVLFSITHWCTVGAEEFRCPPELSVDQLKEIVNRARSVRNDLPPFIAGRVSVSRRDGRCTHYYREIQLPSSTLTWNVFSIDALGEIMRYRREENGKMTFSSDEHDQLLDKGSVRP